MTETLWRDAVQRPDLFRWKGRLSAAAIAAWTEKQGWTLPEDLVSFWARTGGGEIFESEELLSPLGDAEAEDSVVLTLRFHVERGLPQRFVLFHEGGYGLSAVDVEAGDYVVMDPSTYAVRSRHKSLDDWYRQGVRAEYAARYGLAPSSPTA
jgi:hypothetical protein